MTKIISKHPQYTADDYMYFSDKGFTDKEILAIWDRDLKDERKPINGDRESMLYIDSTNPAFAMSGLPLNILGLIASGKIDAQAMAQRELKSLGYDENGKWVGFK